MSMREPNNCRFIRLEDREDVIEQTASILKRGGVVLTPTDTVYGLICLPQFPGAVKKIFDMKQRPVNWNLPIIVSGLEQAENNLPLVWNVEGQILARSFWPGALTLAFGLLQNEMGWLKGRVEVAVRVPDYRFIQNLADRLGPLLMTSANQHGEQTPHSLQGALDSLAYEPDLAIDGGTLNGTASTLVNVNLPKPVIEREGGIPKMEIARLLSND